MPGDAASLAKYREVVGGAVDAIVGREMPNPADIQYDLIEEQESADYGQFAALLRNRPRGEELPVVFLHPHQWNGRVVIWAHELGKDGLFGDDGKPRAEVRRLLAAGTSVVAPDLIFQGEFLADGKPLAEARRVDNPREFAGYTWGYNQTVSAQRAADLLTVLAFVRNHQPQRPEKVYLLATAGAAPWAAAALAQAPGGFDRAAIDTAGFRFAGLKSAFDVNFMSGIVKYGDLPALLSLAAPSELWLAGEGADVPALVASVYRAAGAPAVTAFSGPPEARPAAALEWLLR